MCVCISVFRCIETRIRGCSMLCVLRGKGGCEGEWIVCVHMLILSHVHDDVIYV